MVRYDIINKIGSNYNIGDTENGEFSYAKALKSIGKYLKNYQQADSGQQHQNLD